jgi:predicted metalloprotease with PDZ domain
MKNNPPIYYRILPKRPEAHLFEVTCMVQDSEPAGQRFALPAWTPGSYFIREFARHVVAIRAQAGRRPLAIAKLDKHTWTTAPASGPVIVTMEVYAADRSVRGAHLDASQGFFNGTSVFLRVDGREDRGCEVDILRPAGARYRDWRVATSMSRKSAPEHGFGTYLASDYEELIDHPVQMGSFDLARFRAAGVPHEIALSGRHRADLERLSADLRRLCEWHIGLFGERAPMERYVFLVSALGEGYGGLEHRASTALVCAREDLPHKGVAPRGEAYRTFLGLCSHEYFHTWNVKRIKPAGFAPYDLNRESYTTLLWSFEGVTSYYDDLALARCGLVSQQDYLEILGRNITSLLRNPGRHRQTLAEASFDAWIKYYRQDENSPNALVSYYLKGSLVAMCLDLTIRMRTQGRKSLDDVMRALWVRHGRAGAGIPEDGIETLAQEVSGVRLRSFFDRALRSTEELPLKQCLASVGIDLHLRAAESLGDKGGKPASSAVRRRVALGARTAEDPAGVKLTHVLDGGTAQAGGLAAGDVIVALDGLRASMRALEQHQARWQPGERVRVHAFRRDELIQVELALQPAPADTCWLSIADGNAATRRRREAWLGAA